MGGLAILGLWVALGVWTALVWVTGGRVAYLNGLKHGWEDANDEWLLKGHGDQCAQFVTTCYPNPTTLCDCGHEHEDHVPMQLVKLNSVVEADAACRLCRCEDFTHG